MDTAVFDQFGCYEPLAGLVFAFFPELDPGVVTRGVLRDVDEAGAWMSVCISWLRCEVDVFWNCIEVYTVVGIGNDVIYILSALVAPELNLY